MSISVSEILAVYALGVALLTALFTDGPPYPSREVFPWLLGATFLWPLVIIVGAPLWLYLRLTERGR